MYKMLVAIRFSAVILCLAAFANNAYSKVLHVSPSGDDSITYEENSEQAPWKTLNMGLYNLRAGDTLLIARGVYTPEHIMHFATQFRSDIVGNPFTLNAESGTAENRITVKPKPGDEGEVLIDLKNLEIMANFDNKSYWTFEGLEFINARLVFFVGQDFPTEHNIFRGLKIQATRGGDNIAPITLANANANHTIVEHNVIIGPGNDPSLHQNTCNLYTSRINNLIVRNNIFGLAPIGFYFKHANAPENLDPRDGEIIIENNFFFNHSRSSIETNANGSLVRNNIFGPSSVGINNNESNGVPGGDYNIYEYNTFFTGSIILSGDTQAGDVRPGSQNNLLFGNIFNDRIAIHQYTELTTENTLSKNLFATQLVLRSSRENFMLAGLPSQVKADGNLIGLPDWAFFSRNLFEVESYRLSESSIGLGISGLRDVGANPDEVGPDREILDYDLSDFSSAPISPNLREIRATPSN